MSTSSMRYGALRYGTLGLGAMGAPMARNLHRAGLLTSVWNRTRAKAEALAAELDVDAAADPAALAGSVDAVMICVSADADVLEMVDAVAGHLPEGGLVVDCSTVSADTAQEAARRLAAHDLGFVGAPVSGGTEGAIHGSLAIMCGGSETDFERARPALEAVGSRVVHMGPVGAGQATKAANQIAVAGINQAVSEAMAFAQAHDLPLEKVIEVLAGGAAGSWFLENRGPNMIRDDYPLGFKVDLHAKDLEICRHMAERLGVSLPVVEMTLVHYRRLREAGHGADDVSSLFTEKRELFRSGRPSRDADG